MDLSKMASLLNNLDVIRDEILELKTLKENKKYDIDSLHLRVNGLKLISIKDINNEQIIDIILEEKIKLYEELKKKAQESIDKINYSLGDD